MQGTSTPGGDGVRSEEFRKKIETDTDPGIGGGTCIKYGVVDEEMP